MHWESTLYAYTVRNTTYGKGLANTAARTSDYYTLKYLDTLTGTLDNLNMAANGIALLEARNVGTELLLF